MVADRESDIYLLFARKPEQLDLILRASQDRSWSVVELSERSPVLSR